MGTDMPGRPMHTRSVIFAPGELQVLDEVDRDGFCGRSDTIHPGIKLAIAKTGRSGSFFFPDGSEAKGPQMQTISVGTTSMRGNLVAKYQSKR